MQPKQDCSVERVNRDSTSERAGGFAVKTHDVGESESDSVSVSVKRL